MVLSMNKTSAVAKFAVSLLFSAALTLPSQTSAPASQAGGEVLSMGALITQGKELLEKARAGSGSSGVTLGDYKGHKTMLTARSKSGGAEQHMRFTDFLIVLDGQGTELTGGTIVDRKDGADGEVRGSRLEGATPHVLRKGDIIHIPAGVPHQAIEEPGENIIVYVIKVEEPAK